MRSLFPARLRIVGGLVSLLVSVLLLAMTLGLVPNHHAVLMEGRARLCETIAINSSVFVSIRAFERLQDVLRATVRRDPSILSVGLRTKEGELVTEIGDHERLWRTAESETGIDSHVRVPIFKGNSKWGNVEVRFKPLTREGLLGFLLDPGIRLIMFVGGCSFLLYLFFLRRMLKHLDPSKVVPQRVRSALDTLAEGLLLMDKDERIVLANAAFSKTLGVAPEQLQGRHASRLPWFHDDTGKAPGRFVWSDTIAEKKAQESVTLGLVTEARGKRIFVVHCAPIFGDDDTVRGALASFEDVTPLEEKKAELSEARDLAEQANRAKSGFLARMSHEIRTPINAILGFSEVLSRGMARTEREKAEYIGRINSSGRHLLELINDILDLSKIESGSLELERKRSSPFEIITEVVEVLRVKADEKGIELDYRSRGRVPETILTDPTRFRQILINLVGNAIKFTNEGGVHLVARLEDADPGAFLAVDVIDTGVGIPGDKLEKVFDAFSQADTSITREFGGTGLGLSISRQFARALGGDLSVTSEFGKGSTFTATIATGPLQGVELVDFELIEPPSAGSSERRALPVILKSRRLLVADDGEANRDLIRLVLERAGARVETVENGKAAVDLAARQNFDAILLDMEMPIMDGYTAVSEMRRRGIEIPVFALTAHAMKGAEERCRAAGCSGYLTKPIDMDLVLQSIAAAVGAAPSDADAEPQGQPQTSTSTTRSREPASPADADAPPILSSLPLDDPEFRVIVANFISRLQGRVGSMREAWEQDDLAELARLAHWLKGSGGTAGLDELTEPAAKLESVAKERQLEKVEQALIEVEALCRRIEPPELESEPGA